MIEIVITGELTGKKALLYEFPGRQGRRKFVPTYVAYAKGMRGRKRLEFSVTRDSSTQIFGKAPEDPYGEGGECPPSGDAPYQGVIREDGLVGFRIQLFEVGCEVSETLKGVGSVVRRHLQIHFGAAASHGCILVAGRRRQYKKNFETPLRSMLAHSDIIRVTVLPR